MRTTASVLVQTLARDGLGKSNRELAMVCESEGVGRDFGHVNRILRRLVKAGVLHVRKSTVVGIPSLYYYGGSNETDGEKSDH